MIDQTIQDAFDLAAAALNDSTSKLTVVVVKVQSIPAPGNTAAEVLSAFAPVTSAVAALSSAVDAVGAAVDAKLTPTP